MDVVAVALKSYPGQWFTTLILSTIFWAVSQRIGVWFVRTGWMVAIVVFLVAVIISLASGKRVLNPWTWKAIVLALTATCGGPLLIALIQALGQLYF